MVNREHAAKLVQDFACSIRLRLESLTGAGEAQVPLKVVQALLSEQATMYRDAILRGRGDHRHGQHARRSA